jgi:hypothetical protein
MGLSGGAGDFDWRAFEPIYNSVILSKLALLDGTGLNELARRAGMSASLFPASGQANILLGVFRSMTHSFQWTGEIITTETRFGICGPEDGTPLPKTARCGIAPARGATAGFLLWQHPEAKEKIFGRIFKGFGPGPGTSDRLEIDLPAAGAAAWPTGRAIRLAADQVDHMREIVIMMQEKVAGVVRPAVTTPGRPGPAPVATAVINWGDRCCARDIVELRAALRTIQQGAGPLQNPSGLARMNRRTSVLQVGAMLGQVNTSLDSFAKTRDAATAAGVLAAISRQLEQLARIVAGTQ